LFALKNLRANPFNLDFVKNKIKFIKDFSLVLLFHWLYIAKKGIHLVWLLVIKKNIAKNKGGRNGKQK
jgi:hypothetical protein